jgi:hypothetical protein
MMRPVEFIEIGDLTIPGDRILADSIEVDVERGAVRLTLFSMTDQDRIVVRYKGRPQPSPVVPTARRWWWFT